MRSLLDINVLIALFDSDHPAHSSARRWLATSEDAGWASCPITQNGVLRIMCQPAYPNPAALDDLMERLREATEHPSHKFWPDDISLLDRDLIEQAGALVSKQVTDVYLLALAVAHKGRFVTFDRGVPQNLVRGAHKRSLLVL
jgi:toxin-antitoxin system PIN domain toxin